MSEIATIDGGGAMQHRGGGSANPLTRLPAELRLPVSRLYAVYSNILKGSTALVARLCIWMDEDGLTVGDAVVAVNRLLRPGRVVGVQFPGQIDNELAEEVVRVMAERRRREVNVERARRHLGGSSHAV